MSPSGNRVEESLTARIEEQLQRGLPPPREIYQAQNRDKIDWSQLPIWALPFGPDNFDGCGHEG
jgi:hypothetical protein